MDGTRHAEALAVAGVSEVLGVAAASVRGVDGAALRAATRDGALVRVRYGAYADAARWGELSATARYRLRVRAAAQRLDGAVFSHDSAAVLHGLPRLGAWPGDVHVTVPRTGGGRSSRGVRRHAVHTVPATCAVDRVRCTSVARTVVDVARTWGVAGGLVAADHALAAGLTGARGLAAELRSAADGRGTRAARRVVAAASPLSESVGESLSRARMLEHGLRLPVLQHEVRAAGELVARVDFWWPDLRLVGEFDGRLKYRAGGVPDPRASEDRVWAEKRREDRLRELGLRVIRWTWDDALRTTPLVTALTRAGVPAA